MRLFAAIDIPGEVKDKLRALLDRVRPTADINWSPIENLHVTTKFMGEWPEHRLQEMERALSGIGRSGAIGITVRGIGWFPNPRNPRVFWAGIEGGEALQRLAQATDDAVGAIGIAREERKYSPHLTLARIRDRVSLAPLYKALEGTGPYQFGDFVATAFYLYLSKGGRYIKLADFPLT